MASNSPSNWTSAGTGTVSPVNAGVLGQVNTEFSYFAAQLSLVSAAAAGSVSITQATTAINNQLTHTLNIDYAYTNNQLVDTLTAEISDPYYGNYWDPVERIWRDTVVSATLPHCEALDVGSLTVTANQTTATGVGTAFDRSYIGLEVKAGKTGTWCTVSSVVAASGTGCLVLSTSAAATETGLTYRVKRQRYSCDIDMPKMPVVRTELGQITLTTASLIVNGTSACEFADSWVGTRLMVTPGSWYRIASVGSATRLTLATSALETKTAAFKRTQDQIVNMPDGPTQTLQVRVGASCDGTATTQRLYNIYRVGLAEKYDSDIDAEGLGERSAWWPLRDSLGWTVNVNGGGTIVEPVNAERNILRLTDAAGPAFPYIPALSRRSFQCRSDYWINKVDSSNLSTWTANSCTVTANQVLSPLITEAGDGPTVSKLLATGAGAYLTGGLTGGGFDSVDCIWGLWAKKVTSDETPVGTIATTAGSLTVTGTSTAFASAWAGYKIRVGTGDWIGISSVASSTSLTLTAPATSTTSGAFSLSDIKLSLVGDETLQESFVLPNSASWQLLACPAHTFTSANVNPVSLRVGWTPYSTSAAIAVYAPYVYRVTGRPGVLYPPVEPSNTGALGSACAYAITNTSLTDILHPLRKHQLITLARGLVKMTLVPMFDGPSQTDCTILDASAAAGNNAIRLLVASGVIYARHIDNTPTTNNASLTLVKTDDPTASQVTWKRDTAIDVIMRWDSTSISLSVGGSHAATTFSAHNAVDTNVTRISIGSSRTGASCFDGAISDIEVLQIGAPVV